MRRALYMAPFGELSDPRVAADLAVAAEATGWSGIFVWDHMWRPPDRSALVGDAWMTLAAMASRTTTIRLGPMVVPLARRRPQKVARESVALDRLSSGRLTLGVGLGVNTDGELGRFGEIVGERERGDALDEALDVLLALWSGDEVDHHGPRYVVEKARFLPLALQEPRIPVWGAARGGATDRPLRRASRLDGIFPVGATYDELERMLESVARLRGSLEGFDVAVLESTDTDVERLRGLGATWVLRGIDIGLTASEAMQVASSQP